MTPDPTRSICSPPALVEAEYSLGNFSHVPIAQIIVHGQPEQPAARIVRYWQIHLRQPERFGEGRGMERHIVKDRKDVGLA